MFNRKILIAAVLAFAVVVVLVLRTNRSPAVAEDVPGLANISGLKPYCAMSLQLQRVDWVDEYKKSIDDIAAEGADTVSLIVDVRQENARSTFMYVDMRKTMTVPQLTDIILHAKSKGLRVILMPIVLLEDENDPGWRGTLEPRKMIDPHNWEDKPAWDVWFDNYRDIIAHYARIAQGTGVDVLSVGSELVSSEEHVDEWVKTIKSVRDIYKGQLTYSSNWDRYEKVPFWKYLDFVGMNSYWDLSDGVKNPTVDDISGTGTPDPKGRNWKAIQDDLFKWQATVHKPILLTEAGWCSLSNAAYESWDYTKEDLDADNALQEKLYQAFFQSWWGKPQLAGFVMWEMHPGGDGPAGKGYTPVGKPAEKVMQAWFAKPRWQVAAP